MSTQKKKKRNKRKLEIKKIKFKFSQHARFESFAAPSFEPPP